MRCVIASTNTTVMRVPVALGIEGLRRNTGNSPTGRDSRFANGLRLPHLMFV